MRSCSRWLDRPRALTNALWHCDGSPAPPQDQPARVLRIALRGSLRVSIFSVPLMPNGNSITCRAICVGETSTLRRAAQGWNGALGPPTRGSYGIEAAARRRRRTRSTRVRSRTWWRPGPNGPKVAEAQMVLGKRGRVGLAPRWSTSLSVAAPHSQFYPVDPAFPQGASDLSVGTAYVAVSRRRRYRSATNSPRSTCSGETVTPAGLPQRVAAPRFVELPSEVGQCYGGVREPVLARRSACASRCGGGGL